LTDFDTNLMVYNMDGCAYTDVHNFRANGEEIHKKSACGAKARGESARGGQAGNPHNGQALTAENAENAET
jgi:hypothetical protein